MNFDKMSKISLKTSSAQMPLHQKRKQLEMRMKPFGFCCSVDRFDPLSKYDQRIPTYKSSLPTAISTMQEFPMTKLQMDFFTRQIRERKRPPRVRSSEEKDQLLKNFQVGRNDCSLRWFLEDEIALAKRVFWTEKQRLYNEASDKAIAVAKIRCENIAVEHFLHLKYPRWYQDFSLQQMENLMNLENTMRTDYENAVTNGTQAKLIDIGIVSTFFKLKPSVIRELQRSCKLDSVRFLQEVYRLLTGNYFEEEEYKKLYDCNERIILSAIAFLTMPETIRELHKRLPPVIMPRIPPKPKPPAYLARRRSSCPYKEELFKRLDWAGYRNDLQRWRKRRLLLPIPKVFLPFKEHEQLSINNEMQSKIMKQEKDQSVRETNSRELQTIAHREDATNIDQQATHGNENFASKKIFNTEKSEALDIPPLSDESKKFDFTITGLGEKPGAVEYKICGTLKPPGADKKSWLGEKNPHYIIAGASKDPPTCPVTYEITGVANVTPSNSDERFFAVLKLGNGSKKIFPSGRENLSRNWQEWLRNADEEFGRMEKQADELIKNVQATTRLIFPESVCDDCCSCRQTRKTHDKLRQTKTPYILIDNVLSNGGEKKFIVGSMALHSPAPSLTDYKSEVNLLEIVASQDELETNIIINGVTNENGKIQYYISGIEKNKVRVPSRVPDSSTLKPADSQLANVPPCACIIRQIFNKDVTSSTSTDNIPWIKDDGLCPGKKYRPNEKGAHSCKMYPGDKSCRRNPFIKDITKIKRKDEEKENEDKNKTKSNGMIDGQPQEEKVTEKEKDRFIPYSNSAYDNPWNISRTAPSARILVTDYEESLKLTSPVFPVKFSSSSIKTREERKIIFSKSNEPKKPDKRMRKTNEENSFKILKSSKKNHERKNKEKEHVEDTKKEKKNPQASLARISANEKDIKLTNKNIFQQAEMNKIQKQQKNPPLIGKSTARQTGRIFNKLRKHVSVKKNLKKEIINNTEQLDARKREIKDLKNMMKSYARFLPDIQPVILPWERPTLTPAKPEMLADKEKDHESSEKETYGWRTKSEQELPAKKTLVYLCEPDYPLETVSVRPGGRPCRCRENRSKKKILMYNVSGLIEESKYRQRERNGRMKKSDEDNRIIDGVIYCTPPVSPRRSDEYIPEYELVESPYDACIGNLASRNQKLIGKETDRIKKIRKKQKSCNCMNKDIIAKRDIQKNEIEKARRELMKSMSPEDRWKAALKDEALMDYFSQSRGKRSVKLKMVKPVCECKYERKIVERNEERAAWKARQKKLKALKKQPFMHIVDTSRPMVLDTKLIISEVKRISQENEQPEDIKYCITGVAEDLTMSSAEQIIDGLKMSTPVVTPEPSKEDILRDVSRWLPRKIPPGLKPTRDVILKEEMERRQKARDEAFRIIYGSENEQDISCSTECHDYRKTYSEEELIRRTGENNKISMSMEKTKPSALKEQLSKQDAKKIEVQIKPPQNVSPNNKIVAVAYEKKKKKKYSEKVSGGIGQQNSSHERAIEKTKEKNIGEKHRVNSEGDRKHPLSQLNLMAIAKTELNKMAAEGYIFAKLPICYLVPQFKNWIMYRKGVIFSKIDKIKLMQDTISFWQQINIMPAPRIKPLSLRMTKHQLKKLTYDRIEEMKKKIKKMKAIFYNKVRKSRVLYARLMWATTEFEKFPSASFKKAFFTYAASKEVDGYVYKPWLRNEVRKRDKEFNCYQ